MRAPLLLWALVLLAYSGRGEVVVSGRVLDERGSPVTNAQLVITAASGPRILAAGSSDSTGSFRLTLHSSGSYLLNAAREGYFEIKGYRFTATEPRVELALTMNQVREVFQSLDVNGTPSPVDLDRSGTEERLSGTNINDMPFPSTDNLRNALRFMPGTTQDQQGRLHFQGGAEWQTSYVLEGFRISDPIDGTFTARVGVEGVQSVSYLGGNYSPEYGYGSAGVLQVRTDPGSNTLRYSTTDFVPGVDTSGGLHIGNWAPRAVVSGPIIRDRAWFSDNIDGVYSQLYVPAQPAGANYSNQWSTSNLLHTQWNVAPSNILYTDFMMNLQTLNYVGLAALTPISATQDQRYREWLFGVKDQQTIAHRFVIEVGLARQDAFRRMIPQGDEPYIITPLGEQGNYFLNATQTASRDQFLTNVYFPELHWLGTHQLKFGGEAFRTRYNGLFQRTSVEYQALDGQVLSRTTFAGNGRFTIPNVETGAYAMDQWKPLTRTMITLGVRNDWDELIRRSTWSPRVSVSASPFATRRARVFAGFAVTVDATSLQQFSQPRDQLSILTEYGSNGEPVGLPLVQVYTIPHGLSAPKYNNWTAGWNQDLKHNLFLTARYLAKRGNRGLTYASAPLTDPSVAAYVEQTVGMPVMIENFLLTNLKRDRYDSFELTLQQTFPGQYQWMASYVRSSAVSTAVFNQSIDQPLNLLNNFGPLPWDAPNHFVSSAFFPVFSKNWAIAYLMDLRSGFPYSVQDDKGNIVGEVNSHRFPINFDLNLHVERRFEFRGHRFALRVGVNNLTDHKNPTAVYNTIGTPQFGQFTGDEGRHFVLRIRFFGKGK